MAGAFSVQGKSMFLTFAYGVMYVLSFATIITVFATTIALAVFLIMIGFPTILRVFWLGPIPISPTTALPQPAIAVAPPSPRAGPMFLATFRLAYARLNTDG